MADSSSVAVDTGQVDDTAAVPDAPAVVPEQGQQTSDDKGTPSTPDQGEKSSMLDAVKTALKPKADAPPASQTPDQKPATAEDPGKDPKDTPEDDDKEPSEEETKNWSARTQRRFRKLNADVRARDQLVGQLTPKAEEFDRLDQFVRNSGLSREDVQGTLRIAAQMRSDPVGAYNALLPMMAQLEETIGYVLPPTLQQRVQAGYLTQEDALAQNRANAQAQLASRQLQEHTQAVQEHGRRQAAQDQLNRGVQSVETWEQQRRASDPDWHLKQSDIRDTVELLVSRQLRANPGWVPTPEEALAISQDAEKQVTAKMKQFIPKPVSLPRPSDGGASPRSQSEPKSLIEAMRASIRR
jgi:hypothetical protein